MSWLEGAERPVTTTTAEDDDDDEEKEWEEVNIHLQGIIGERIDKGPYSGKRTLLMTNIWL